MNFDRRASVLVVLPREKYKVVRGATLELFVCDSLQVLSIILSDSGVVSSNDDIP